MFNGFSSPGVYGNLECDSHADTCCAGRNCVVLEYTNQIIDVFGFHRDLGSMKSVPIASVATVATNVDGQDIILIIHEALWFGDALKHSLISINQVRSHGVHVWDNPCDGEHILSVYDVASSTRIPLEMHGIVALTETRAPTKEELKSLPTVELTSSAPWDPIKARYELHSVSKEFPESTRTIDCASRSCALTHDLEDPIPSQPEVDYDESNSFWSTISSVFTRSFSDVVSSRFSKPSVPSDDLFSSLRQRGFSIKVETRRSVSRDDKLDVFVEDALDSDPAPNPPKKVVFSPSQFPQRRHQKMTKDELIRKWRIGPKTAEATLRCTRQQGTRHANMPLSRQYPTGRDHNRFPILKGDWYADVFFDKTLSVDMHTCCLIIYNSEFMFTKPLVTKSQVPLGAEIFSRRVGMPERLTSDNAPEFCKRDCRWLKWFQRNGNGIDLRYTPPGRQRGNLAEQGVKWVKKRVHRTMSATGAHKRLWNYCVLYETDVFNRIHQPKNNRTGWESVYGNQPDISEYLDFEFYGWIWFWDMGEKKAKLGRWLGVNHYSGEALSSYVLKANGKITTCTTVQALTADEVKVPAYQKLMVSYDENVPRILDVKHMTVKIDDEVDDIRRLHHVDPAEEILFSCDEIDEADELDVDSYNKFVGSSVALHRGGEKLKGKVVDRVRDDVGNLQGRYDSNPLLDTSTYVVKFEDGSAEEFSANVIAEAIFAQVDDEGREHLILDEIIDHRRDDKVSLNSSNCFEVKPNGNRILRRTTIGWDFLVKWKDGSENWIPLKDLKESNPVEVVEYAQIHALVDEPAFAWWVPHFLAHRDRIIKKLAKSKYWRTFEKLGVRIPKTIEQAFKLDTENGNNLWREAIMKEMRHVLPAFANAHCTLDDIKKGLKLVGFQRIGCHMVFDVKMDFTRKARFVAGGHTTDPPPCLTYASVVSRESVRIAFLIAALNDLDVSSADIGNAYLNADCAERIYTVAGKEFGAAMEGQVLIVKKALYGLKSSGAAWRKHLAESIKGLGFVSTRGDPDVYIRSAVKPTGEEYYEYLLVYVDDLLCVSHDTSSIMLEFSNLYRLKEGSVGPPSRYLGADIAKTYTPSGVPCWAMGSHSYFNNAIRIVNGYVRDSGRKFRKASCPFHTADYHPELDDSPLLDPAGIARYQELIGILRWGCELGRLDILHEVALMSTFLAAPRQGHLDEVYHIFSYLELAGSRCLMFDPTVPGNEVDFPDSSGLKHFYDADPEPIPDDMPAPRGIPMVMTCFADASHASNKVTMRSHTGVFIKLNGAPIVWYSKRQNTVESSTFGSEFIALRIATELCQGLRYKLRSFGIPIDGPTSIFVDNQSVFKNTTTPESKLKKKHVAICYHKVRECIAAGWVQIGWITSSMNLADLFTKVLDATTRSRLLETMMPRWNTPAIEVSLVDVSIFDD